MVILVMQDSVEGPSITRVGIGGFHAFGVQRSCALKAFKCCQSGTFVVRIRAHGDHCALCVQAEVDKTVPARRHAKQLGSSPMAKHLQSLIQLKLFGERAVAGLPQKNFLKKHSN